MLVQSQELARLLESVPSNALPLVIQSLHSGSVRQVLESLGTDYFTSLLKNTAHLEAQRGYRQIETIWGDCCVRGTAKNFKTKTKAAAGAFAEFPEVKEHGQYELAQFSDEEATYAVGKRGLIFSTSMEAQLDDELGELGNQNKRFGQAGARTIEKFFVETHLKDDPEIYDGKALFHADHNNDVATGSGYTRAKLNTVLTKFIEQTGRDGEKIMVLPRILIVPPDKYDQALRDVTSNEIIADSQHSPTTGSTTFTGRSNEIKARGHLRKVLTSPYLTGFTGFFVMGDPNEMDTFQIDFLDGKDEPSIFIEQPNTGHAFQTDEIRTKARQVFGGAWLDYRAVMRGGYAA